MEMWVSGLICVVLSSAYLLVSTTRRKKQEKQTVRRLHRSKKNTSQEQLEQVMREQAGSGEVSSPGGDVSSPELTATDAPSIHRAISVNLLPALREEDAERQLWQVRGRGFLPAQAPLKQSKYEELAVLAKVASEIPVACVERTMHLVVAREAGALRSAADFLASSAVTEENELELAMSLYSYILCAWARGSAHGSTSSSSALMTATANPPVPSCIGKGMAAVARLLGRRPMLDYAGCVLYNWEFRSEDHHVGVDGGELNMSNVRMLRRFTGLVDEEWFMKTHLVIEAAAAPAISAVALGATLVEDVANGDREACAMLLDVLHKIESSFGLVVRDCLPLMFERVGEHGALCDYYFFYNRLRPFITAFEALTFEGEFQGKPLKLPGPSGAMSTVLPVLDAFLGVSNSNKELGKLLDDFALSMPVAHREFLESLRENKNFSVRCAIVRARLTGRMGSSELDVLSTAFDCCVDVVLDFRWRHLQMVRKYIIEPSGDSGAVGTGGTSAFEYLHEHISDTEAAKMKQAAAASPGSTAMKCPFERQQSTRPASPLPGTDDSLWAVDGTAGFLPRKPPADWRWSVPSVEMEVLVELARKIPFACAGRGAAYREMVHAEAPRFALLTSAVLAALPVEHAERARSLLAFVAAAYSRCDAGCSNQQKQQRKSIIAGDSALPVYIAEPLAAISSRLQRPKRLCYTDLVLYNWTLGEDTQVVKQQQQQPANNGTNNGANNGTISRSARRRRRVNRNNREPQNPVSSNEEKIQTRLYPLVNRFLAVEDEDSLWSVLIDVEQHSPLIVGALLGARSAIDQEDLHGLCDSLSTLRSALRKISACHDAYAETRPESLAGRGEMVTMRRLKHFVFKAGTSDVDVASYLYSGDAALMPAIFSLLGVPRNVAATLQRARDAAVAGHAMPKPHRDFVRLMQKVPTARVFASAKAGLQVHELAVLEAEFNGCLDDLLRFCSRRSQLVCRCLPHYAQSFRENEFEAERKAIRQARLGVLLDRRLLHLGKSALP